VEKDSRLQEKDSRLQEKDKIIEKVEREKDSRLQEKDSRLQEKDKIIEKVEREKDSRLQEKDKIIEKVEREKDSRLQEKDIRIMEKEAQMLAAQGLLTSRGILEALLKKCLIEMKLLKLAKDNQQVNMTNIIQLMIRQEEKLPKTSKCYQLLQAAKKCGCDLVSLYGSLCYGIHGAPWHGPSIKIFSKELKEEERCMLVYIADDMSLPYELTI
jgi:hypothetical protein